MNGKAPIIYVGKQLERSVKSFVKLNQYVNSNKRLTKSELNALLEKLKTPLFLMHEAMNPPIEDSEPDESW